MNSWRVLLAMGDGSRVFTFAISLPISLKSLNRVLLTLGHMLAKFYVSLTQARVTGEEEASIEIMLLL